MRIFQVSPHFPPRSIGGVEIYVKRLSDALRAFGDEPHVAALENVALRGSDVRAQIDTQFGYPVHRLEASLTERTQSLGMIQWDPLESTCRHASLSIL